MGARHHRNDDARRRFPAHLLGFAEQHHLSLIPSAGDPPALTYASGAIQPGTVRLAVIFHVVGPTQARTFRMVPTMLPPPSAEARFTASRGAIRQSGRELTSASALATATNCAAEPTAGTDAWCNQPVQRRRSQILGDAFQAVYYAPSAGNPAIDVDAAGLPPYAGLNVRSVGQITFDDSALTACTQPALNSVIDDLLILREEAAQLGISIE